MLRNLQKEFLQSFYQKDKVNFLDSIQSTKVLSVREQFAIYSDSITEGLAKALRENFPVTEKLVGEDFFRFMSYEYIAKNPSTSPNLGDYGILFPEFVANFPAAKCLPYLPDVCSLEWCWQKSYYGVDYAPLDIIALSKIDSELHPALNFKRCSNSSLLKSDYPIRDIWNFNQNDTENCEEINLHERTNLLLIWRPNLEVIIEELTEQQWLILNGFDQNLTLGQLTEQLKNKVNLNDEIPNIVAKGWFSHFELMDKI